jgi:hypothetical protein
VLPHVRLPGGVGAAPAAIAADVVVAGEPLTVSG